MLTVIWAFNKLSVFFFLVEGLALMLIAADWSVLQLLKVGVVVVAIS